MKLLTIILILSFSFSAQAANEIDAKLKAAMTAESRPQAHIDRDKNRKPLATLNFFRLKDNMRVLELIPGGGWYTRLLAPVLAENGKFYVAIGTNYVKQNIIGKPNFEKIGLLESSENVNRNDWYRYITQHAEQDDFDFGVNELDMILTFRNLHNFGKEVRQMMNVQVFEALKHGGYYGVVDHTRRHMEKENNENGRRIDPVLVIKEMMDIGFEFVDYSDLHFRADDELEYEVGRRSVSGNTDRFTMLFRKP
ncbi:MAG: hypothetical protein P8J74_06050 [Woeseiaceae bacterium]|nr:hypothetical protein [Woeseiaceae bacterium]